MVERIEAHSGAVIERSSLTDNRRSSNSEVNVGLPTINDQIDSVLNFYSDVSQVDLVLVSGCGNDVGVQNLLNASTTALGHPNKKGALLYGDAITNILKSTLLVRTSATQ